MKHKILVIAPTLGIVSRGAETFTFEVVRRLALKWDVTVVLGSPVNWDSADIKSIVCIDFAASYPVKLMGSFYEKLISIRERPLIGSLSKLFLRAIDWVYWIHPDVLLQKNFAQYLRSKNLLKQNWDIVFPQNGVMGVLFAKRTFDPFRTKIAYTGHGGVGRGEKLILRLCPDAYIAISSGAASWASSFSSNVSFIPNGVDLSRFKFRNKRRSDGVIRVLSVGALTSYKRHALTIRAVALLPNATLKIVGSGELLEELKQEGRRLLGDRIEIVKASYSQMSDIYRNVDIFVLPSLNEPMGIVYLEALATGLPIVAPNDFIRREVLADHGNLVEVADIAAYAKAILDEYKQDTDDAALSRREYVEKSYSWDVIAERYHQLFLSLIESKDGSRNI